MLSCSQIEREQLKGAVIQRVQVQSGALPETLLVLTRHALRFDVLPRAGSHGGDGETEWRTVPEFLDLTFLGVDGDLGGDISASASSLWWGSSLHSSLTDRSAQTRGVRKAWGMKEATKKKCEVKWKKKEKKKKAAA